MDREVVAALEAAGVDTTFRRHVPSVGFPVDERDAPVAIGDEVAVTTGRTTAVVRLKTIPELWTGDTVPPDFSGGPTRAYEHFFLQIEQAAAGYCHVHGKPVRDQEFERLYNHLRRRPGGTDSHPLFSYLQAAARLYMSLRDVSRAEFEAVARRLCRSARTFSEGYTSTNYFDYALAPFLGVDVL